MDKEQIVSQLMGMAEQYQIEISPEILGKIVNMSFLCC